MSSFDFELGDRFLYAEVSPETYQALVNTADPQVPECWTTCHISRDTVLDILPKVVMPILDGPESEGADNPAPLMVDVRATPRFDGVPNPDYAHILHKDAVLVPHRTTVERRLAGIIRISGQRPIIKIDGYAALTDPHEP